MTSEAALTKLAFLLSNPDLTNDKRKTVSLKHFLGSSIATDFMHMLQLIETVV